MRIFIGGTAVGAFLGIALACGGTAGGLAGDQAVVDACYAFVDHMQSLDCMPGDVYSHETTCPDTVKYMTNGVAFYECQVEKSRCTEDGVPDMADLLSCNELMQ